MSKKDKVQREIINTLKRNNLKGIMLASIRSGKCRQILTAIKEHSETIPKVLIAYPIVDIKNSWIKECELIDYQPNIMYTTFASIEKMKDKVFDYVIFDEAQLLAEDTQLKIASFINKRHKHCIFASGTYSSKTLEEIKFNTGLDLIVNYTTEQAIEDGIISDFNIFIHTYNLNGTDKKWFGKVKKWQSTEVKECNRLSNKVNTTSGQERFFHALSRMRFINSCDSLVNAVKSWIKNNPNKRFLLFTGDENVGKKYNLPMYNSKSKTDEILKQFQNEEINQLCLIKKGGVGITYKNLNTIILTAINSNGESIEQQIGRGLLDDTEDCNVHIFVSSEQFQLKWLNSALENVNKNKIKWIKNLN